MQSQDWLGPQIVVLDCRLSFMFACCKVVLQTAGSTRHADTAEPGTDTQNPEATDTGASGAGLQQQQSVSGRGATRAVVGYSAQALHPAEQAD